MNFEESSYFSNVRKNSKKIQIFGKDFSVKNAEKKIQQKQIFQFFSKKKYFFDFFLILFFFHGKQTN